MAPDTQMPQDPPSSGFLGLFKKDLASLWADHKLFLIIFGVVLLIVKFREVLISILVSSSKRIFERAQQQDGKLQQEENAAKQQADELAKKANDLPNTEKPVDNDWYKK